MLPVLLADALLLRAGPPATKVEAALSAPAWLQAYRRHVLRCEAAPQRHSRVARERNHNLLCAVLVTHHTAPQLARSRSAA